MSMRRFRRLTNALSRKMENHAHAVTLHIMHCNFCRIRQTLQATPAVEAGVTDRLWDVEDIEKTAEDAQTAPKPTKRNRTVRTELLQPPCLH